MTEDGRIRTFLAIDFPHEIKKTIERVQERLKLLMETPVQKIKWPRPDSIHLTLQFFGYITLAQVKDISALVKKNVEGAAPFMLKVGSLGAFPSINRPRVLYLGIEGAVASLSRIQEQIASDTEALGFKKEERAFQPHLTLGRLKSAVRMPGLLAVLDGVGERAAGSFTVQEFILYKSDLRRDGPIYTALESFPFGKGIE